MQKKHTLLFVLLFLISFGNFAFSQELVLSNPQLSPAPLFSVRDSVGGRIAFDLTEEGGTAIAAQAFGEPNIQLRISLASVALKNLDVRLLGGSMIDQGYFTPVYDTAQNMLILFQGRAFPALTTLSIDIPISVTQNTPASRPLNGFLANISALDGTPIRPIAIDSFTYTLPPNTTVAIADINSTLVNVPVTGNVLTNDIDRERDGQFILSSGLILPNNGTLVIDSTGNYTYTPRPNFQGRDVFSYVVCDTRAPIRSCDTTQVYIDVINTGLLTNKPIAINDANKAKVNTTLFGGDLLANDFDLDEDDVLRINIVPVTSVQNGRLTISPNGTYTYIPNPNFVGRDTFTYSVCDNANPVLCDTATVIIRVLSDEGNVVYANDDMGFTPKDSSLTSNVLLNDTDPDRGILEVESTPIVPPANGVLNLMPNGQYIYTPQTGFVGNDAFVYVVCEQGNATNRACDTATVYLTILDDRSPDYTIRLGIQNNPAVRQTSDSLLVLEDGVDSVLFNVVLNVEELLTADSDASMPVIVVILKTPEFQFSYDASMRTIGGENVSNGDWTYDNSNPIAHIFRYTGNGGVYASRLTSKIGLQILFRSLQGNERGDVPLGAYIQALSGGENNSTNNSDVRVIRY